ncbi:MAG: AAA family ATPase [Bacteroidales bacterium]|jgi:RecA-family ATPase|nr:AAA family ATPase [Bacteroidales bacterium]MDD4215173.1 AAA family ATPase [Bacteroidales bacterium]
MDYEIIDSIVKRNSNKIKIPEVIQEITGTDLLLNDIEKIPCLLDPIFQQTGIAGLAGSSDTGKSMLLRQFLIDLVTGNDNFLGFPIYSRYRSGIYVSSEDLYNETSYILKKQASRYKPEDLKELRFVFDIENLIEKLDSMLTNKKADVIIIDCFADVYGEELRDTSKIRQYLHKYQELAQKHECLIIFIHHSIKRTETLEPSKNNLNSGQGFESKMRVVIELRADNINPDKRHLCIVKANYLPASYKKESYVLEYDNDNFSFSNTGERILFEFLSKKTDSDQGKAKYEIAKELKAEGYTHEKIGKELGIAKSTVSKLFKKYENDVSNVSNGNK